MGKKMKKLLEIVDFFANPRKKRGLCEEGE